MNLVNRILILMELLALIPISLILIFVILLSRGTLRAVFDPALNLLTDTSVALNSGQVVCIGILTVLFAFGIILFVLELYRGGPRRLKLHTIQGADVLMSSDAITQQLEYTLDGLTDVIKVQPRVQAVNKGQAVDIFIELWTTANVDVQAKTQEVMGVARQVVEDRLGLKVGKVQIKIDQLKMPKKQTVVQPANKSLTSGR